MPREESTSRHAQSFDSGAIQREIARREAMPDKLLDIAQICKRNNIDDSEKFARMLAGAEISQDDITDAIQHSAGLRQQLESTLGEHYSNFVGSALPNRAEAA